MSGRQIKERAMMRYVLQLNDIVPKNQKPESLQQKVSDNEADES